MLKKLIAITLMMLATLAMAAVDVNKATEADLDGIKGIGPATSKLIMSERKNGDFKNWEDFIARVKGVGDSRATKLSEQGLTVNGDAFKATAATKKDDKSAKDAKKDAKLAKNDAKAAEAKPAASSAKAAASASK
jgi:competence protein ComEA